jgi:hypothetical protein
MEQSTLFKTPKQLSRNEKLRKSKKVTADLTSECIDYLNANGFICHRSNNFPSQRITRKPIVINAFDATGKPLVIKYEEVNINYKKNNIKNTILDISGFRNDGIHTELEVKSGKDELSDEQIKRIKDIKAAGGISFAFKDKESFLWQIKPFIKPRALAF